jgi:RNA polymerase sigma-70 factor (ECF subfamily)
MPSEKPTDTEQFGELVQSHRPLLLRVALRLARNPAVAEDLVQDTLVRALGRAHQFQQGTHVQTWLAAILTHLFLDLVKHRKVEVNAEPELAAHGEVEFDPTIATTSDDELRAAVDRLPPELREVVELCYFQQMRYRDAAAILKTRVSTVGTRLMRARTRLRELLSSTTRDAVKS